MSEIRKGLERGLTIEQTKFYADPKFNDRQMGEIRLGFENGLTVEQVKTKFHIEDHVKSINDKLDALEERHKLTSTQDKEDIIK